MQYATLVTRCIFSLSAHPVRHANNPGGALGKRQGSQPVASSIGFRSASGDNIPSKAPAQAAKHLHTITSRENFNFSSLARQIRR